MNDEIQATQRHHLAEPFVQSLHLEVGHRYTTSAGTAATGNGAPPGPGCSRACMVIARPPD
jgi:hypothetical protein